MLIAHFSDPHILYLRNSLGGLRNFKQILGLANWLFRRRHIHRREKLKAVVQYLLEVKPSITVITGDLCQLAIPADYLQLGYLLEPLHQAGIPIIMLQGNHDHYAPGKAALKAFKKLQERFSLGCLNSEGLPEIDGIEFIPVDGAVPTPSFHCWGKIDADKLRQVEMQLEKNNATAKARMAFGHFPLLRADGSLLPEKIALREAKTILNLFEKHKISAYLCGHIHKPFSCTLPGGIPQYCAGTITGNGVLHLLEINNGKITDQRIKTFA